MCSLGEGVTKQRKTNCTHTCTDNLPNDRRSAKSPTWFQGRELIIGEQRCRLLRSLTSPLLVHSFAKAKRPMKACFLAQGHRQIMSRGTAEGGQANKLMSLQTEADRILNTGVNV